MDDRLVEQCPRCGAGRLQSWQELVDEEREVALRLPGSAEYSRQERQSGHRWCTRCWYEATGDSVVQT